MVLPPRWITTTCRRTDPGSVTTLVRPLMTGQAIEVGEVLRVRCSSQVYEFVLPTDEAARWKKELPSRIANP